MKRLSLYLSFLFLVSGIACSKGAQFSKNASSARNINANTNNNSAGEPLSENYEDIGLSDIQASCQNEALQTSTIKISFPKPANTCNWGSNGNLNELNGFFQARIEQTKMLNLPAGAIICDAQFDFAEQDFLYDDHFLLLFNKSVIASSYNFENKLTASVNNLLEYNWSHLAGMNWISSQEQIYCPQIPGATASCSFPGHDTQGLINLAYDPLYIQSVMANGLPQNHSFSMVSVGDNDAMDCEHSDVEFNVQLKYVQ